MTSEENAGGIIKGTIRIRLISEETKRKFLTLPKDERKKAVEVVKRLIEMLIWKESMDW